MWKSLHVQINFKNHKNMLKKLKKKWNKKYPNYGHRHIQRNLRWNNCCIAWIGLRIPVFLHCIPYQFTSHMPGLNTGWFPDHFQHSPIVVFFHKHSWLSEALLHWFTYRVLASLNIAMAILCWAPYIFSATLSLIVAVLLYSLLGNIFHFSSSIASHIW